MNTADPDRLAALSERVRVLESASRTLRGEATQLRKAAETRRTGDERVRRVFELGLIGMAITAPKKSCVEVNDRFCELLGSRNRGGAIFAS